MAVNLLEMRRHAIMGSQRIMTIGGLPVYENNCYFATGNKKADVVTESNLKKAYSIDVKLIELDDERKVCVPLKTNLKLDLKR